MSKLSISSETIKKLGITGIGIDSIEHQFFLFQQFEPKIVNHKPANNPTNSGIYYVEGDITDFISGYDYFWVNTRSSEDVNIFQVDSATYDSDNLWTEITVTNNASYKTKHLDIGSNICGRMDATDLLKSIGSFESTLMEDGSISNAVASSISFEINDEDRVFYDRNNKTGYFYQKDAITEVRSVQSLSDYAPKGNIHSTFVKVKNIPKAWKSSDFINGHVEFITGDAAGAKSIITGSNGYNLKLLGYYAPNYVADSKFHLEVKNGDTVRLYKSESFWYKLDVWHRSHIDEKVSVAFGKLDLGTIMVNDKTRLFNIQGFNTIKDLYNKDIRNMTFEGGSNLSRLTEVRPLLVNKPTRGDFKPVQRAEGDNLLNSVKVMQVAFDVPEGWHILDYHPYGNLFRFDLGRWYSVRDEGSFEKSTGQVFLTAFDYANKFQNPAKMPAHDGIWAGEVVDWTNSPPLSPTYGDTYIVGSSPTGDWSRRANYIATRGYSSWEYIKPTFGHRAYDATGTQSIMFNGEEWTTDIDAVNNILVERNWHGKWCSIKIDVEDVINIGSTSGQYLGAQNYQFKKLKGLPDTPYRILFYVDSDRRISSQTPFAYSYDNGGLFNPHIVFDFIQEWDIKEGELYRDLTYEVGMGASFERLADYEPPLYYAGGSAEVRSLRCYHHKPFNGIILNFDNKGYDALDPTTYGSFSHALFSEMMLKFSQGDGEFSSNMNLRYWGGKLSTVTDSANFTIQGTNISESWDENCTKMAGMRLVISSNDGFLETRKIKSVTQDGTRLDKAIIELEEGFSVTPTTDTTVSVINKNFDLKVYDLGQSFKDGLRPDICAYKRTRNGEEFRDFIYHSYDSIEGLSGQIQPLDEIYFGYRSKFDSVMVAITGDVTGVYDDYANQGWYQREMKFVVEYWDGYNWKTSNNISVIPTTQNPIRDYSGTSDTSDDYIKYKISFEAEDWNTGGYDHTNWTNAQLTAAPSNIDEDEVYCIRIRVLTGIAPFIQNLSLCREDDLNVCLLWEDFESWYPNLVSQPENLVRADSLNIEDMALPLFGVELYWSPDENTTAKSSTGILKMARPVTRLQGSLEDSLFIGIDYNNINPDNTVDAIVTNTNTDKGFSIIPRNFNLLHMTEKILDTAGFKQNKQLLSFRDSYNKAEKDIPSIIGSDYDGVYPFDVGWDAALQPETFTDYMQDLPANALDICIRRVDDMWYCWVLESDQQTISLYQSYDLKTWEFWYNDIVDNIGTKLITAIDVIYNRPNSGFLFYVTYKTSASGSYRVSVYHSSVGNYWDANSATEIIVDASNHYGKVTAVQLEGDMNASSGCARLLWVEKFSGTGESGGKPTGTPSILLYSNADAAHTGTWTLRDTKAGYRNPIFVKAFYTTTSVAPFNLATAPATSSIIVAEKESDSNLYRLSGNLPLTSAWSDGVLISGGANPLASLTFICDSVNYNLRNQTGETATALIPATDEVGLVGGIDSNGDIKVLSLNSDINDWDANGYFKNQLIEHNSLDWFRSYKNSITFDRKNGDQDNRTKMYFGFRKPFGKMDSIPQTSSQYHKLLQLRYWNGNEWNIVPNIYQNNRVRTDGKFHPNYGLSFEKPLDWSADIFLNVVEGDIDISQNINALYWVEVSLGDYAADTDTVAIRRIANCFTSLFLTKGRSIYYMEDWDYVRSIWTYPFETDKKIKIDSVSGDYESKLIFANIVDENPYFTDPTQTVVFDMFGKFKDTYPLWLDPMNDESNSNQYQMRADEPTNIYRFGYDHEWDITSPAKTVNSYAIGTWTEEFMQFLYDGGTHSVGNGKDSVGWNIPVPFEQKLRKKTYRGLGWINPFSSTSWNPNFSNNVIISRRGSLEDYPVDTYQYNDNVSKLVASISNCGLLHEELINSPYVSVTPGWYAALEKSFLVRSQQFDVYVKDYYSGAATPNTGDVYLYNSGYEIYSLVYWDGSTWQTRPQEAGTIIYNAIEAEYWIWSGNNWINLDSDVVWPGRESSNQVHGIGLEWSMGAEGVNLSQFRPYNLRPSIYKNGNVLPEFDYKISAANRNMRLSPGSDVLMGHNSYANYITLPQEIKVTCAAEMRDLSAMKDSPQSTDAKRIQESSQLGAVYGMFAFNDLDYANGSIPDRLNTEGGGDKVEPLGMSAISIHKPFSKVRDWKKAWHYDWLTGTYSDITDAMNYRTLQNNYELNSNGSYIYLCMDTRFFALTYGKSDDLDRSDLYTQYYSANTGWEYMSYGTNPNWQSLPDETESQVNFDKWSRKTCGYNTVWNPFLKDWTKSTINGVNGYWVRIRYDSASTALISWVTCSGMHVWDNMRWWQDYSIISDTMPSSPSTQEDYAFFDSWFPISVEYDESRNRISGCFWNFAASVNRYYPFTIQFDRSEIKGGTYDNWSWELDRMEIIDREGLDYSNKIQSIKNTSPVDNKALLIQEAKADSTPVMASIKNFHNGDLLFANDID
jgi:hypothetical protein